MRESFDALARAMQGMAASFTVVDGGTRETRTVRLLDQDNDPAAHALQARRRRNTGPAVHADPRRNQRRPR